MADNYEFISAADLPTTDAKEVDVLCVENGELKRKPGASVGGGGGYVIRLPADTMYEAGEVTGGVQITIIVEESYDNFIEVLNNGGTVSIDISDTEVFQMLPAYRVIPSIWGFEDGTFGAMATLSLNGIGILLMFAFPNGTSLMSTE